MKKLTLLLLLMISTNVMAEWTKVSDSHDLQIYVDYQTIKRKGNKVKLWSYWSHNRELEEETHTEWDCEEETKRLLDTYSYDYDEHKENRRLIYSDTNIKKDPLSLPPGEGSINRIVFKIACDKK